jgi:cathepsin D
MGGFQVPKQPWLLVDQTSASLLDGTNAGIMGLAFDTIANTEATPFWQTLAQGGTLASPEMSFWMNRLITDQNAQDEEFGGIFTLGGQNQTLYTGDVEFLPLVTNVGRQTYWLLTVSGPYRIHLCLVLAFFSRTCLHSDHCEQKHRPLAVHWQHRCH